MRAVILWWILMGFAQADFAVEVSGVTGKEGFVRALVFATKEGFPESRGKAMKGISVKASEAKGGKIMLRFVGVKVTEGVVSVFHDQDGSGTMKKSLIGVPKEPVAISGWSGKGRPKFEKCFGKLSGTLRVVLKKM
ncbi:MAG: DUF2141 domain-containing protein [Roseibacillus sp.]